MVARRAIPASAATGEAQRHDRPITVAEFKKLAEAKLDPQVWDYYVSGADDEVSVKRNEAAFNRLLIRPRVLRDVSHIDPSAALFGKKYAFPVGIAPSAMQKLVGGHGEIDTARAAANRGTFMILSSNSTTALEDVIRAPEESESEKEGRSPADFWFQIYISQDRGKSIDLIRRAEAAGYTALVLTVDTPVLGNRINERKTELVLPPHLSLANLDGPATGKKVRHSLNRAFMNARSAEEARQIALEGGTHGLLNDATLTWEESVRWLRSVTSLKIVVKGVMTAEDALLALRHGVDGIVVSNHGGRQLDSVSSTLEALPEVVDAVRGRIPVIVDGGISRGSDVFKALALGADFTLVGRPALWGLSHAGQDGVEAVLNILERELSRTMALAGASTVKDITRDMLGVEARTGFGIAKL